MSDKQMSEFPALIDNKAVYTVGWSDFTTQYIYPISSCHILYSIDKGGIK